MEYSEIGLGLAFLAGLASFFSPCVFALVPAYIGYMGGRSAASARGNKGNRLVTLSHAVAFSLGFTVVFMSMGLVASTVGGALKDMKVWLARIGGVIVIFFGLHMTGILRLKFLEYDLRPQTLPDRRRGYFASFLMGIFFSAGWSPCVGPILGMILTGAMIGGSIPQGLMLLAAYSAGLAIPFLIAAVQIDLVMVVLRRYGKVMHYVEIGFGVVLILVGILLLTGKMAQISAMSSGFFVEVENEVVLGIKLLIGLAVFAVLGLIPAWIAARKGKSFLDWWFFGMFLFLIALPLAIIAKPTPAVADGNLAAAPHGTGPDEF